MKLPAQTNSCPWRHAARAGICTLVLAVTLLCAARLPAQEFGNSMSQEPMPLPSVSLTAFPTMGYAPLRVGFRPSVDDPAGSPVVAYDWNFGDGTEATSLPPALKTYTRPGTYVVSLTVEMMDGRSATGFVGITVKARERRP